MSSVPARKRFESREKYRTRLSDAGYSQAEINLVTAGQSWSDSSGYTCSGSTDSSSSSSCGGE